MNLIDQAEIHRKTLSDKVEERRETVERLSSNFSVLKDRKDAWADFIRLTGDENHYVRWEAIEALGAAFPHVPDKTKAWVDLIQLTGDQNSFVRVTANHALGRVSIFKATEAETEDEFRKEIEAAIAFFEESSREAATDSNPARFCPPFYRFSRSQKNKH